MNYCQDCGRSFKTVQGLLGHRRMVHGMSDTSEVVAAPVAAPVHQQVALEESVRASTERLDRIEVKLDEIVMMPPSLGEPHDHTTCQTCKHHENAVYESVVAHYEQIPGVTEARNLSGLQITVSNFPYPELLPKQGVLSQLTDRQLRDAINGLLLTAKERGLVGTHDV